MQRVEQSLPISDALGRPLRNLRVSVTDRCNLRCRYCMPEDEYVWLPREDLLSFEELSELVGIFTDLGVEKVRLTGGEPLLRRNLPVLVRMLAQNSRIRDLAMTTNGVLLAEQAQALAEAGLGRLSVSLDTLRADRFHALTKRDALPQVLEGIEAARRAGFSGLKIDAVMIRGTNEDELAELVEFGKRTGAEVRFIEYMDVGGATHWSMDKVFSRAEMLDALSRRYGRIEPIVKHDSAPAEQFLLPDGAIFGIIASVTAPFCRTCDRSRLTADGLWYLCLYAHAGNDLRRPLRSGMPRKDIEELVASGWRERRDRGAEERKEMGRRSILIPVEQLRRDPHLEMHTRGG